MSQHTVLKIVVACGNARARIRAANLVAGLTAELKPEVEVKCNFCEFESLEHPQLQEQATDDAIDAEMIIIATDGATALPARVDSWMEGWRPEEQGRASALVVLTRPAVEDFGEGGQFYLRLQRLAAAWGMDFFCRTDRWPPRLDSRVRTGSSPSPVSSAGMPEAFCENCVYEASGINE